MIATGARARVPGWAKDPRGGRVLRSLDDAQRIHAALADANDVVIVGAGFLGTEIAATARALGENVTLIDVQASPMRQQLGAVVSQRLERCIVLTMSSWPVARRSSAWASRRRASSTVRAASASRAW